MSRYYSVLVITVVVINGLHRISKCEEVDGPLNSSFVLYSALFDVWPCDLGCY